MSDTLALPITRTLAQGAGDFCDAGLGAGAVGVAMGARLVAGAAAAATAQITDQDGTVLYNLAATAGSWDESTIPVRFVRKASLAAITGAGSSVTFYQG